MGVKERKGKFQEESYILCFGFCLWSDEKFIFWIVCYSDLENSVWGKSLGFDFGFVFNEMYDLYVNYLKLVVLIVKWS